MMTPGPADLIVMAQFMEPYTTSVNVIVPATITFDPPAIDAGVLTTVTVGVFEADGITPKPGLNIWAEGVDYTTTVSVTGLDGLVAFPLEGQAENLQQVGVVLDQEELRLGHAPKVCRAGGLRVAGRWRKREGAAYSPPSSSTSRYGLSTKSK